MKNNCVTGGQNEVASYPDSSDTSDSRRNTRDQSDDKDDKDKPDTDVPGHKSINARTLTITTVVISVIDVTSTLTPITVTELYPFTETRFKTTTMPRKHKTITTSKTETETTQTTEIIVSTIATSSSSTSSTSSVYTAFNAFIKMDPNDNGCL